MTRVLKDIALDQAATGAQTGTVCEPSLAVSGKRMLLAGNWFCSRSVNGGSSWSFIDPYTELPTTGAGVCCDQLVYYSKKYRLWIWLLQFRKTSSGNIFRIAVSSTGASGSWTWWDTAPVDIDTSWTKLWFDYPDMVETETKLMFSFNMYNVNNDRWERAVVVRFSLADLKARGALPRQAWSTTSVGSLRFARGPGKGAIFAGHINSVAGLHIFEWKDASNSVTEKTVEVSDWSDGPYIADGPSGAAWLNRLDDRITGGWRSNGIIGFAWSAAADASHPKPYVRVVRLSEADKSLIDEPDLWSASNAWAYPSLAPNQRGDVGMTAFSGAPGFHPAHAVGWLDEKAGKWRMKISSVSTDAPMDGVWGDYLDIQPDPSRITYWLASGFVLNGGASRTHIQPRIVSFKP